MNIFITGASGFAGGAAAAALTQAGHDVKAMARSQASAEKIRSLGAEPVMCALESVCAQDLDGCEAVVHYAAFVEKWGTRQQFWEANVDGTERLLKAARDAGVRRFVHISTEVALFHGQHMRDVDETYPYAENTPYLYGETKREAEKRALAANDPESDFSVVVIRPKMIWGPGDTTVLPTVREMVQKGEFMWMDGGRWITSTTHVANLTHGVRLALATDRHGEVFFITDEGTRSFREFLTALLATEGLTPPNKSIPGWLGRALAYIVEGVWNLFKIRKEPPLTRYVAAAMSRDCTININKAKQELGYEAVMTVGEGLDQLSKN